MLEIPAGDMFNHVYPKLLPHSTKHGSGEYYTPDSLARLMVSEVFEPGCKAIDPSCGSGMFLVAMLAVILESPIDAVAKGNAIARVGGMDKNPLAIFMATINAKIILTAHGVNDCFPVLMLGDSLFFEDNIPDFFQDLDVVIGNPPWIVIGGIENGPYKERLKALAISLGIYVGGKNASNLEMASLFVFKYRAYLRTGGQEFFILPNSIITGSQHDRVRSFDGFDHVVVWRFSRQPFRIHSVCLLARKAATGMAWNYQVPFVTLDVANDGSELTFAKGGTEIFEPANVVSKGLTNGVTAVNRFIPVAKKSTILPREKSPYAPLFYKGAQIFPRTMFFVEPGQSGGSGSEAWVEISPSTRVEPKKLARWNFLPFETATVESRYIFPIAKSTALLPFHLIETFPAFLPYTRGEQSGRPCLVEEEILGPKADTHFSVLERVFSSRIKEGASHSSLRQVINYQNCMINPRQLAPIKVVYNGGGSIVKAAMVGEDAIIDYSMFYYPANDMQEAQYLLGYLNSRVLTESVKLVGSTGFQGSLRNIVKHPLDFPLPLFDPSDELHVAIARAGQLLEERVQAILEAHGTIVGGVRTDETTRLVLQGLIFKDGEYNEGLDELDRLVLDLVGPGK